MPQRLAGRDLPGDRRFRLGGLRSFDVAERVKSWATQVHSWETQLLKIEPEILDVCVIHSTLEFLSLPLWNRIDESSITRKEIKATRNGTCAQNHAASGNEQIFGPRR